MAKRIEEMTAKEKAKLIKAVSLTLRVNMEIGTYTSLRDDCVQLLSNIVKSIK